MAVNLERIDNVLTNPTTVNLHKNSKVESNILVKNRTDLASVGDMGQNFIYSNDESLESDPRFGRYKIYNNITEDSVVGSMNTGVQRNIKSLSLKSLTMSLSPTQMDALVVNSSNPFSVTLNPTPNVTNLVCNISLGLGDATYQKYFTITKIDNFRFTVTPDYEKLLEIYGKLFPFTVRFIARDVDNNKIAYSSTGVTVNGYIRLENPPDDNSSKNDTQYVHIMYSINDDHSDMEPALSNAIWMGILTDFNVNASTDPTDYTWSKIKGDRGSEGQVGKDGVNGKDGNDAIADPMVDVVVSSNTFPVGQDGWSVSNKDIYYNVRSYNTLSSISTKISIDQSGNPYAYSHGWFDGFLLGKIGLDIWTLFNDPGHQKINTSGTAIIIDNEDNAHDEAAYIGKYCIDVPLRKFKDNTFIKDYDRIYSRFGLYIKNNTNPPILVSPMFTYDESSDRVASSPRVKIDGYQSKDYRYISTYGQWRDNKPDRTSWIDTKMYLRIYFENETQADIEISEYMIINLDEILPSGHKLAEYIANAQISDIIGTMDLLPWFSGEYEAGVDMTWGTARRMFTQVLELNLIEGKLKLDPNYITNIVFNHDYSSVYLLTVEKPEVGSGIPEIPNYDYTTKLLDTYINEVVELYYQIPNSPDNPLPWDFSGSSALVCNTSDLPYIKYGINLEGCTEVFGSTEDLPRVEEYINLKGCTGISGKVIDIPEVRTYMSINSCNQIVGDASELWWMKNEPDLEGSGVVGDYPYKE